MNFPATIPEKRPEGCPPGQGTIVPAHGGRIGNPPYDPEPNRELIRRLNQTLPVELIADVIGVSYSTLYRHHRQDLAESKAALVEELGKSVLLKARNGDNDMLKFYLARHGGWDKRERHEHTGANGGPIQHVDLARLAEAFAGMSEDELAIAERVLSLVASSGHAGGPDSGGGSAAAIEGGEAEPTP